MQRWDILQAQGWAHQIFGCFECTDSHALQANSCLSRESFQIICQAAFKVCLLKPWRVQQEKSFDSLSHKKTHLAEKLKWGCPGVQHDQHSVQQTLSSADWHTNPEDVLIPCCEGRITAFSLANKLCWTAVNTPQPLEQQMHLTWLDLPAVTHTPGLWDLGRKAKLWNITPSPLVVRTTARSFRKPGPESVRKTRNHKVEEKQRSIKNRALQTFKFKPWKSSRSYPSPSLYPLSHCSAEHL